MFQEDKSLAKCSAALVSRNIKDDIVPPKAFKDIIPDLSGFRSTEHSYGPRIWITYVVVPRKSKKPIHLVMKWKGGK